MPYFVYIAQGSDSSLYTGFTTDIEKRLFAHNNKAIGAKALRGKKPVTLVYQEEFATKSDALKREAEIKSWSRQHKLQLITTRR